MIATMIIFFICEIVFVFELMNPEIVKVLALNSSTYSSRPYTIITSIFTHASLSHLIFNMVALIPYGFILESRVGTKDYLKLFFIAGVMANVVGLIVYNGAYILGASAAIMGVIGALAVIMPKMNVPVVSIWYSGRMPLLAAAGFWIMMDVLGVFASPGVAHFSHLTGIFIGFYFGRKWSQNMREKIFNFST